MSEVLPDGEGATGRRGDASPNGPFVLDEATKQLLRHLVAARGGQSERKPAALPVDWEEIWARAADGASEDFALGSAFLAAEAALNGGPRPGPSALLARAGREGSAGSTPASHQRSDETTPGSSVSSLSERLRKTLSAFTWLRNVGLIVVLFAVWQLWGTGIAESQSQNRLKAQYQLLVKADTNRASSVPAFAGGVAVKAGEGSPYLVSETKALSEAALPGGVLGRLRIPAIGVDDYFVEGVGEAQLQEGPGEYPGSGLPGQPGNLAIAGHRTTFGAPFFRLGDLSIGDRVIIDVPGGRATYRVSQPPFAVSPYDLNVLADYGDARLTLTTCNPPFFATTRLIVVAKLSQWLPTGTPIPSTDVAALVTPNVSLRAVQRLRANAPAAGVRRPNLTRASSGGLSEAANDASTVKGNLAAESNGWHFDTLPWAAGVVAALCALGGLYKRLSRFCMGASRWLVMVPLWAAGLLALFRVLGMLLPADL